MCRVSRKATHCAISRDISRHSALAEHHRAGWRSEVTPIHRGASLSVMDGGRPIAAMRPFLGTEAIAARTATRRTLRSRYRRIFHNVYIAPEAVLTPVVMAEAAWLFGGRQAVLASVSAAALHGDRWLHRPSPPELMRRSAGCCGLVVHRVDPAPDEVMVVGGMAVTTPARTAFDLGRRKGRIEALIRCDALAYATGVTAAEVTALSQRYPGSRGVMQLRQLLTAMDGGAESPQETRTRLVLLDAGLRKPQTQIEVYDEGGYPFARIDMGYEQFKVGIEYDGAQHWIDPARRAHDVERRIELAHHGWVIIHVTSDMLRNRPWLIVQRVVEALQKAGCPWLDECRVMSREFQNRVS